ncbi:unnamed protein product, partial [Effrenium voratum]
SNQSSSTYLRSLVVLRNKMGCLQSSRPPYVPHVPQYSNAAPTVPAGYKPGGVVQGQPVGYSHEAQPYQTYQDAYQPYQSQYQPGPYQSQYQPGPYQSQYQPGPYQAGFEAPYQAQAYQGPAYTGHGNSYSGGGGGNGMAMAGAGLAGLAGGFIAAELIDDIF